MITPISLSAHLETWMLDRPFSIASRTSYEVEVLVVTLQSGSHRGHGEAKGVSYLGETADSMFAQIASVKEAVESGATRKQLLTLLPKGGARNSIDCALWDLEAKQSGKSIWELASVGFSPVNTCRTIGIEANANLMGIRAKEASAYSILKIKLDDREPIQRVAAVRDARPDARLIVDANQAWSFSQLEKFAPELAELGVEMIEQPLPRGADSALERYDSPVTLCADESCQDRNELTQVGRRYKMINIKLDKTGGLTEGLLLIRDAQKLGLEMMVGCMLGTSLAMLPGMVIAQFCRYRDLDAPLWLKYDRLPSLQYRGEDILNFDMHLCAGKNH